MFWLCRNLTFLVLGNEIIATAALAALLLRMKLRLTNKGDIYRF
jgi:hypothetical protein